MPKDIQHLFDEKSRRDRERVRELIRKEGMPEILADFDQQMKDIDSGLTTARNVWHSISPAQRTLINYLATHSVKLVREGSTSSYIGVEGDTKSHGRLAGLKTVRSLAARDLLAWEGGAFDPEAKATLTEKAVFVFKKAGTRDQA